MSCNHSHALTVVEREKFEEARILGLEDEKFTEFLDAQILMFNSCEEVNDYVKKSIEEHGDKYLFSLDDHLDADDDGSHVDVQFINLGNPDALPDDMPEPVRRAIEQMIGALRDGAAESDGPAKTWVETVPMTEVIGTFFSHTAEGAHLVFRIAVAKVASKILRKAMVKK